MGLQFQLTRQLNRDTIVMMASAPIFGLPLGLSPISMPRNALLAFWLNRRLFGVEWCVADPRR